MSAEFQHLQEQNESLKAKWRPILDLKGENPIKDNHRRGVIANLLENTAKWSTKEREFLSESVPANYMGSSSSTPGAGGIDTLDPVLISLIRRTMPNLIAYDVCGTQTLTGPTGLIFAMKSHYRTQTGGEALGINEANSAFSATSSTSTGSPYGDPISDTALSWAGDPASDFDVSHGMTTTALEGLSTDDDNPANNKIQEMAFSIGRCTVTAKGRALAAGFTLELQQDLRQIHGLDAESELANILSTEILTEINREVIRTIYGNAKRGCSSGTATQYYFDLDSDANGRWSVERFKGLHFRIEQESNIIARETRRGKGNIFICSSDVASALQMAGVLEYNPQLPVALNVDDTGSTFAGLLHGRVKVFIDPYFVPNTDNTHFGVVGYKGTNPYDAGIFYCPYIPLFMARAVDPRNFQPRIGFKTRYGIVVNPFVNSSGTIVNGANQYYRRFGIKNIS